MVDDQEVIQRSIYMSLLNVSTSLGYTLNPDNYSKDNQGSQDYEKDKSELKNKNGFYLYIYGSGNNYSKGMKETPRIVVQPHGFIPGEIGFPRTIIEKEEDVYKVSEVAFETTDQLVDIIIVSSDIRQERLLHNIMYTALPQRGYIKPYIYENAPFSGNIYIEHSNFYDKPNLEKGIMEKVYTYIVKDTLLYKPRVLKVISSIKSIEVDVNENNLLVGSK